MDQQRPFYPVQQFCQVLDAVPSRYYAWRVAQAAGAAGTTEPAWETDMVAVFDLHKRRYGTRRLQVELRETGHRVGRQALRTGLRRHGPCSPSPSSRAPPIRPTGSAAPRTCCSTSRARPRPTGCG